MDRINDDLGSGSFFDDVGTAWDDGTNHKRHSRSIRESRKFIGEEARKPVSKNHRIAPFTLRLSH